MAGGASSPLSSPSAIVKMQVPVRIQPESLSPPSCHIQLLPLDKWLGKEFEKNIQLFPWKHGISSSLLLCCTIKFEKMFLVGVVLWHCRLRIQHCHCSGVGHCCGSGSVPSLGISHAAGAAKKKKKKMFLIDLVCFLLKIIFRFLIILISLLI